MRQRNVYKYCPVCGHTLRNDSKELLICTFCSYHFYLNPKPCNCVIIENEKGEILLVKRRFPPKKGQWDLPGGFMMPDESFEESVRREIQEELHCEVDIEPDVRVYKDSYVYKHIRYATLTIAVRGTLLSKTLTAGDDISAYEFVPKEKVFSKLIAFESVREALKDYLNT